MEIYLAEMPMTLAYKKASLEGLAKLGFAVTHIRLS